MEWRSVKADAAGRPPAAGHGHVGGNSDLPRGGAAGGVLCNMVDTPTWAGAPVSNSESEIQIQLHTEVLQGIVHPF